MVKAHSNIEKALIWRGPTSKWRRDHKRAHVFANIEECYTIKDVQPDLEEGECTLAHVLHY